jgi:hypothetical protein
MPCNAKRSWFCSNHQEYEKGEPSDNAVAEMPAIYLLRTIYGNNSYSKTDERDIFEFI